MYLIPCHIEIEWKLTQHFDTFLTARGSVLLLAMLVLVTKLSLSEHGAVLWVSGSLRLLGFLDIQHMKVTRMPAIRTSSSYSQKIYLVPIKSMKILITPSGIEPVTFQL
jgi:hypothetical protein